MERRRDYFRFFSSKVLRFLGLGFKIIIFICNRRFINYVKQGVFIFIFFNSFIQFRWFIVIREVIRVFGSIIVQFRFYWFFRVFFNRVSLCFRGYFNYIGIIRVKIFVILEIDFFLGFSFVSGCQWLVISMVSIIVLYCCQVFMGIFRK